ncbi:MAG: HD domain-containing protein, partial [Spirochaetes bacterium]|nr:HD domain-containing protein [Spirochaetota bacterium]MBU0954244.1 HD domain-containing protein [Spirochaetota bacterium]
LEFTQPVRDPLWKNIMLPPEFSAVIDSAEFMKLGRICQLGPAGIVYPGATHTRRAHSFGVFHLAKRLLDALAGRYPAFSLDPLALRSYLMAALCHDLGHFPYTHSLKELPLVEHEELSGRIITGVLASAVKAAGADPELTAAIIDDRQSHSCSQLGFLRSLLSGVLDPDKLDYLNRDAWACGVPYGTQDVDFILQHIGLDSGGHIAIDERGIMAVEAVLFSKYQMYRAVYWHRNVRAATAMIKKAILAELTAGNLAFDKLYGLDDAGFYQLMQGLSPSTSGLINSVLHGQLYSLCYEQVYDPDLPAHARCLQLGQRQVAEQELSELLGGSGAPLDVVIDIPEPISFESDLPVLESGKPFSAVSTVFGKELVRSFERALRVVRVFCKNEQVDKDRLRQFMDR